MKKIIIALAILLISIPGFAASVKYGNGHLVVDTSTGVITGIGSGITNVNPDLGTIAIRSMVTQNVGSADTWLTANITVTANYHQGGNGEWVSVDLDTESITLQAGHYDVYIGCFFYNQNANAQNGFIALGTATDSIESPSYLELSCGKTAETEYMRRQKHFHLILESETTYYVYYGATSTDMSLVRTSGKALSVIQSSLGIEILQSCHQE